MSEEKWLHVCAWCRHGIADGKAYGVPCTEEEYRAASHGGCEACMEAFERGVLAPNRKQEASNERSN